MAACIPEPWTRLSAWHSVTAMVIGRSGQPVMLRSRFKTASARGAAGLLVFDRV